MVVNRTDRGRVRADGDHEAGQADQVVCGCATLCDCASFWWWQVITENKGLIHISQ